MKASDFKEVERKGDLVIVRWDATPETITIPARKKGGEESIKESGYVICTERVYNGEPTQKEVKADIDKDLAIRYTTGEKPVVNIDLSKAE